jgi:uracil-DNA glycosylase
MPKTGYLMPLGEAGRFAAQRRLDSAAERAELAQRQGLGKFTDAVIKATSEKEEAVVFVLWELYAQRKRSSLTPQNIQSSNRRILAPIGARRFLRLATVHPNQRCPRKWGAARLIEAMKRGRQS